jgi:hypothetical protein
VREAQRKRRPMLKSLDCPIDDRESHASEAEKQQDAKSRHKESGFWLVTRSTTRTGNRHPSLPQTVVGTTGGLVARLPTRSRGLSRVSVAIRASSVV